MLKQPITLYTYCGMAGDLQLMLIAETSDGQKATRFFSRVGWFKWFSFFWALIRIIRELQRCPGCQKSLPPGWCPPVP